MTIAQPVVSRFAGLEFGRGIAALLITLFYATGFYEKYFGVSVFGNPFRGGHAGFEYFFVLAGFFIYTAHASDIGRPGRLGSFAYQRAIHIYPMYWLVVGLLAAAMLAVPSLGAEKGITPGKALLDFLMIPRDGALVLPPAWALQREMVFYLAFALLLLVPRLGMAVFVVWQAAILFNTASPFAESAFAEVALDITNIGFAFGMIGAHLVMKDRIPAPRLLALLGLAGFAAGLIAEWYYVDTVPMRAPVFGETIEKTYYNVCAAITIPALAAWEQRSAWRIPRFLTVFGGAAYMLFLINQPVNSVVVKLLANPAVKPMLTAEIAYSINIAITVALAVALHLIVEKPVLSRLRAAKANRTPSTGVVRAGA
ncbi:peptidoglycan/LPS O-acetylase OafA/YrhL [Skermanella aerolata]|uniref:acyltransferase family protein n=1 Tax=Skermanella aerolata TaxID=393310 RepID=UPI003D23A15A